MTHQKKIIIFRSAPSWLFQEALRMIRSDHPEVVIDVYCPKILSDNIREDNNVNEVFDDNWEGFFRKSCVTSDLIKKFRDKKYDQVVVLYNDAYGFNYAPLRKLAVKIKPGKVVTFNILRNWSALDGERAIGLYLLSQRWAYRAILVVFAVELVATTLWDRLLYRLRLFGTAKAGLPERSKRMKG